MARVAFYGLNKARWRLRTSDRMEACRKCPHIFICRGGCAAEAALEHGSYFRESCHEFRELFAFTASRVVGMRWEDAGEEELSGFDLDDDALDQFAGGARFCYAIGGCAFKCGTIGDCSSYSCKMDTCTGF